MIWWIVINWNVEVWSLIAYEVQFVIQPQLPFLYWTVFLNVIRVLDPEGDHINDRSLLNKIPSFLFFLLDWGSILHCYLACFYRQKEAVATFFAFKWNVCLCSKIFAVLWTCLGSTVCKWWLKLFNRNMYFSPCEFLILFLGFGYWVHPPAVSCVAPCWKCSVEGGAWWPGTTSSPFPPRLSG